MIGSINRRRMLEPLISLIIYTILALIFFGKLGSWTRWIFGEGGDPETFIWFLHWMPFAISHGLNPFISNYVWFPAGANLTWDTSVPLAALLFAPITLLGGAVLSFNLLSVTAPALSAWTAFLLARYVTRDWAAAVVGGYLFGFSSYEIGQLQGHLNLDLNFLVPLAVLLCLRRFHGNLSRARFIAGLTIVCTAEIGLSAEILATLSIFGALSWALFFAFAPGAERGRLRHLAIDIVFAGFATVIVASPFLIFLAMGYNTLPSESIFVSLVSTDALNFFIPTVLTLFSGSAFAAVSNNFIGYYSEHGAYLGLPLILLMALYFRDRIALPYVKALLIALLLIMLCSLGPWLQIGGVKTDIALPWTYPSQLPLLTSVLPGRFTMYVALISALVAALWLALPGRRLWRFVFAVLACIALFPNPQQFKWSRWPTQPFFTPQNVDHALGAHRNVLVLPFSATGNSMAWQVDAAMRFTQAGGYTGGIPNVENGFPVINQFFTGKPKPEFAAEFIAYCARRHVDDVLIAPGTPAALNTAIASLGWPERLDHGVEIIKVPLPSTVDITGNYWPSPAPLNWMGRRVRLETYAAPGILTIAAKFFPFSKPLRIKLTSATGSSTYMLQKSTVLTLHIPAATVATLTASRIFIPDRTLHNGDMRELSALISFTSGIK